MFEVVPVSTKVIAVREEVVLDHVRAESEAQDEVGVSVVGVVLHHVPQDRAVPDVHHRLRDVLRVLSQPHAETAAEQNDFHAGDLPFTCVNTT